MTSSIEQTTSITRPSALEIRPEVLPIGNFGIPRSGNDLESQTFGRPNKATLPWDRDIGNRRRVAREAIQKSIVMTGRYLNKSADIDLKEQVTSAYSNLYPGYEFSRLLGGTALEEEDKLIIDFMRSDLKLRNHGVRLGALGRIHFRDGIDVGSKVTMSALGQFLGIRRVDIEHRPGMLKRVIEFTDPVPFNSIRSPRAVSKGPGLFYQTMAMAGLISVAPAIYSSVFPNSTKIPVKL